MTKLRKPSPSGKLQGDTTDRYETFQIFLSAAVPLRMMALEVRGGATPEDFASLRGVEELLAGPGGEALVVGLGKKTKEGTAAHLANEAARAVSILSYCPGGIRIFGLRCCGPHRVYGVTDPEFCKDCVDTK